MALADPLLPMPDPLDTADDQEAVAANIRALMGRHRVSQARLAAAVGLSTRGISERMNGKTNFTVRELGKIARFFGKSLGDVVTPLVLTLALVTLHNEECVPPVTLREDAVQLRLFEGNEGSLSVPAAGPEPIAHKEAA